MSTELKDEDDFTHYYNAVGRLRKEVASLTRQRTVLREALGEMSCTCPNPDGYYPHDANNPDCNLSIAAAALATPELPCAGYEGCHELEGVMYDLFVHDPACPKSPEQKRLATREEESR